MTTSPATVSLIDAPRPLLRRTALLPHETLASLLARLTLLNFYTSGHLIRALGRRRLAAAQIVDDPAVPTRLETFQELARLTGQTLDTLYAASHQRFADWLVPLDQPPQQMPWLGSETRPRLDQRQVGVYLRPPTSVQYCPQCLEVAAYQRLSWLPRSAAMCVEHQCLLLDGCLACGAVLTVSDLVARRCHSCQIELHHLRSESLAGDILGLRSQQVIQGWFGVIGRSTEAIAACHLPPQSPHVLYRLLQLIARQLLNGRVEWANLPPPLAALSTPRAATMKGRGRLTTAQTYLLYRCAFAGLLDWPVGLEQLLDAYGGYDTQTHASSRRHCVQRLQRDWFRLEWQDSSLAFVQPVLLEYVLKRGLRLAPSALEQLKDVSWFAERIGLWTEERTCQALDLQRTDLRRFCENGSLSDCLASGVQTRAPRFKPAAILKVKQRWIAGWSLHDVSSWLKLKRADVLGLMDMGLLSPVTAWAGDPEQILFERQAVKDFFAQVSACLKPVPESWCELLPLNHAVREVRRWSIDLAVLIQCALIGLVSAFHLSAKPEGLDWIYFNRAEICELPDQLFALGGWVDGDRFAYEYGLASTRVHKWWRRGLIKPRVSFSGDHYFDLEELKSLAAQHGFVSPAKRLVRSC